MFSQLATYGIAWWLAFVAIAFTAARLGGVGGVFAGQVAIAIIVATLDVQWIQTAMDSADWDEGPDQDAIFYFGVLLRIVLVNTALLPVSLIGWVARRRSATRRVE